MCTIEMRFRCHVAFRNAVIILTIVLLIDKKKSLQAIADIVDSMKWRNFAAIYETDEGLSRLQKTLTLKGDRDNPLTHTTRQLGKGPDYRSMLKEIRSLSVCNIIIDVEPQNIMDVLYQAKEVRLLADYCHFVITYLVLYIICVISTTKPHCRRISQAWKKNCLTLITN